MKSFKHIFDIAIMAICAMNVAYAVYMFFIVWRVPDAGLVLGASATSVDLEWMIPRRMYAMEFYLSAAVLIVYLGLRRQIWNFDPRVKSMPQANY